MGFDPMSLAMEVGAQAALEVQNTALGLALEGHNDRRQLRQQGKLLEQQAAIDQKQAIFNRGLGIQTWKETGPVGMTEELKKAGLSPALYYGKTGGGPTTGSAGGSVNAEGAPRGGGEIMTLQLMGAQKKLLEAQTAKAEAEAAKTAGVDTGAVAAGTKLTQVQTELAEIEKNMNSGTYESRKAAIEAAAAKAQTEAEVAGATKGDRIDIVQGELIGLTLANELKRTQTGVAEEQIKKIIAEVKMGWKELDIQAKNAATNLMNAETARINANTSIREFLEHVRKNDYDYELRRGALELEKWLKDVPESQKLTVGAMQNVLINAMPKRK